MAINLTKDEKALLTEHAAREWSTPGMVEHIVKSTSAILTIRERIVTFDKPTIQTRFHFGEHGHDFDEVNEYAHSMSQNEMYFVMENLDRAPAARVLRQVEDARTNPGRAYLIVNATYTNQPDDCALGSIIYRTPRDEMEFDRDKARALTPAELDQIETVALAEQTKFEKRLMTYLKRYGLTKCSFNTYWADR